MANLLYYPYINLPQTDWTIRTLLYYDKIGSIIPEQYFNAPGNFDPYMQEIMDNDLVEAIIPMDVLKNPWEVFEPFINYLDTHRERILKRYIPFTHSRRTTYIHQDKISYPKSRIHSNKFDDRVFRYMAQMGLAVREDHSWYAIEQKTAGELMTFLATVIGNKLKYQPVTDQFRGSFSRNYQKGENFEIYKTQKKRELILKELIPYPENFDLKKLRRFKDNHLDLLERFRNKTEQIVLNPSAEIDSPFFQESLRELKFRKEELSARMNESRLGPIFFGTICGIAGAFIGLAATGGWGTVLGLPGFANAIHSALQIERAEDIFDQSGMKYLALLDKKLQKKDGFHYNRSL